jgi:hypothetical protein
MSLARLPAAIVLASLVALTAHLLGFGTSHTMGGIHGGELLAAILAAAAVLSLVGIGRIAFARRRLTWTEATDLLSKSLPLQGPLIIRAGLLLAGASLIFAASEALEGRGLTTSIWALFALPAAAAAAAYAARKIAGSLAGLGLALRAVIGDATLTIALPGLALAVVPGTSRSSDLGRAHRGRAPPNVA